MNDLREEFAALLDMVNRNALETAANILAITSVLTGAGVVSKEEFEKHLAKCRAKFDQAHARAEDKSAS